MKLYFPFFSYKNIKKIPSNKNSLRKEKGHSGHNKACHPTSEKSTYLQFFFFFRI